MDRIKRWASLAAGGKGVPTAGVALMTLALSGAFAFWLVSHSEVGAGIGVFFAGNAAGSALFALGWNWATFEVTERRAEIGAQIQDLYAQKQDLRAQIQDLRSQQTLELLERCVVFELVLSYEVM